MNIASWNIVDWNNWSIDDFQPKGLIQRLFWDGIFSILNHFGKFLVKTDIWKTFFNFFKTKCGWRNQFWEIGNDIKTILQQRWKTRSLLLLHSKFQQINCSSFHKSTYRTTIVDSHMLTFYLHFNIQKLWTLQHELISKPSRRLIIMNPLCCVFIMISLYHHFLKLSFC